MSFGNSPPRITESFKRFVTSLPALPAWPFFKFDSPFVAFFHSTDTRRVIFYRFYNTRILSRVPSSFSFSSSPFFPSLFSFSRIEDGDKSFWITMNFHFFFFFFSRNAFKKSHHAYYRTNRARSFFFVLIPIHPTAVRRTNEPWIFRRPANSIDNECLSIRLLVTYSISPRILRIRIPRETSAKDGIRVGSAVQAK